eukprot:scaffold111911_cov60-Phaeocystis_antarctica.AAC.1
MGAAIAAPAIGRAHRARLPPPLPPLAKRSQPPHLARPCQHGPADDFSDTNQGARADPIGRLRIIARLTAVYISS